MSRWLAIALLCACSSPPCGDVETIATGRPIWGGNLAADEDHVYWTEVPETRDDDVHSVWRAPSRGGPAELVWSGPSGFFGYGMAVADGRVYWTGENAALEEGFFSAPVEGGEALSIATLPGRCALRGGVAIDGGEVFAGQSGCRPSAIVAAPAAGGPARTLWSSETEGIGWIGARDGRVFFTTQPDGGGPGAIVAVAAGGGDPRTMAVLSAPRGLAIHDRWVYAIGADTVVRVPLAGGDAVTLASGLANALHLAVDASGIYVASTPDPSVPEGEGAVHHVPLTGGEPELVEPGRLIGPLASDGTAVYFTEFFTRTVRRFRPCRR